MSKGPDLAQVPRLSGLTADEAEAALAGRGCAGGRSTCRTAAGRSSPRARGRRAGPARQRRSPTTSSEPVWRPAARRCGCPGRRPAGTVGAGRAGRLAGSSGCRPASPPPSAPTSPWAAASSRGSAYAREIGAGAVQVFVSNPRGWAPSAGDPRAGRGVPGGLLGRSGVPVYVHAPYLVNFGSPTEATRRRSVDAVRHALARGAAIGAAGVVVHAGSAVAGAHRDDAMGAAARSCCCRCSTSCRAGGPRLLVEPTAGGGQALAATVQDLGPVVRRSSTTTRGSASASTPATPSPRGTTSPRPAG